jgi:hypothetical protein
MSSEFQIPALLTSTSIWPKRVWALLDDGFGLVATRKVRAHRDRGPAADSTSPTIERAAGMSDA